ncbi:hypothetical protein CTAYLR_009459 [Chrysophaeum taylorii]|uniref:non-specific serine/threonine protein kinase n=1 Tax=Chrysophaeum taylorii TaxID=2483200 RepID=A0AAD7U659_9STRA|nr:hypothetical protein CTAYLR_009459 [Chrysophaeum taylorii]
MEEKASSSGGVFGRVLGLCSALLEWVQRLGMLMFAPRHKLDGGMVVLRGGKVGEGGFSYVFGGVEAGSWRRVVLKQVRIDEPEQYASAMREVEAHRRFDHPNLMPLLDFSASRSVALMVFPMCSRSLRQVIDAKVVEGGDAWVPEEFSRLFDGTCRGAKAIHASGLAHRDIKPENVLIDDGRAVLMDFGSMAEAKVELSSRRDALVLQDEASVRSTMSYRAPELWEPEAPAFLDTAKADVWALGCLLWAMAYGYSPFEADFPTGGKRPRVVECSHLRVLVTPAAPPKDAIGTRHEPDFFLRVQRASRALLVVDPNTRPDIDRALQLSVSLKEWGAHADPEA